MAKTTAREALSRAYPPPEVCEVRLVAQPTDREASPSPEADHPLSVRAFGVTDRGLVRPTNEDQFVLSTLTGVLSVEQSSFEQPRIQSSAARGHLLIVADGLGGHVMGEEASQLAVAEIEAFSVEALAWLLELRAQDAGVLQQLKAAFQRADIAVTAHGSDQPTLRKMGTTLTIAYNVGSVLYLAHAGDSRCYVLRGGKLVQITRDHNVASALVAMGHPELSVSGGMRHIVTNIVGGGLAGVRTELHAMPLSDGDVVLLCTDGLTEMLSDDEIGTILEDESDPERACVRLVANANRAGGRDNITAIVARFSAE